MPAAASLSAQREPSALDALATVEAALVTLAGVLRQRAAGGELELDEAGADLRLLEAMQCQDEAHLHFLASLGGAPVVPAFALPERLAAERGAALAKLLSLKEISLGAQMAFAHALAGNGDKETAEVLFALGAVEGGHEALLRQRLGREPANGRAFLAWRFADPLDALPALAEAGSLDDDPSAIPYPGPLERRCAGVTGLVPETTAEVLLWDEIVPASTP